jgi:hypothetical protein
MLTPRRSAATAAVLVTGIGASFAAWLVFRRCAPHAMQTALGDPGVLARSPAPPVPDSCALGCLVQASAPPSAPAWRGRGALFGLLFIPTLLTALLRALSWLTPSPPLRWNASDAIYTVQHQAHTLQPWPGLGVFSPSTRRPPSPPGSS